MPSRAKKVKRFQRRRRKVRRGLARSRVGKVIRPKIYFYKRTGNYNNTGSLTFGVSTLNGENINRNSDYINFGTGSGNTSNITYLSGSYYFTISDMPDYTEFTSLYDQYRIFAVKVKIMCFNTNSLAPTQGQANGQLGAIVHHIIDHDDSNVPPSSDVGIQTLREYQQSYRVNTWNGRNGLVLKRFLKPRIATAAYGGGAFGSYTNTKSWVDSASNTVQHYGVKFIAAVFSPQASFDSNLVFTTEVTQYIGCRDVR